MTNDFFEFIPKKDLSFLVEKTPTKSISRLSSTTTVPGIIFIEDLKKK